MEERRSLFHGSQYRLRQSIDRVDLAVALGSCLHSTWMSAEAESNVGH